jgi:tRNA-binding protein
LDPWTAFQATEIRVGTIVSADPFPEARVPAIKLEIEFGAGERLWSSAQITDNYAPEGLVGRQVLAVTNLPPRRIAGFKSECLTLGIPDDHGNVALIGPDRPVPDGGRVY